ncbi:Flp family type IVb pilin [Methylotuvimicrobium buryatense]|uniref:Flp family type IVb pilin n=1 Tax=Methylotuvimicrobium buryatense TaxID=95641 RepID=A0A4P9USR6_METBY|nr:Flp family type IVb pilin [Methylotuvimicrobium buryatense]QCW83583.1 Flp family type IVb pilin [Methylotuvimicrobium buryatense]
MNIQFKQWWGEFLRDEEGASGIEYALIAAMVAVALVAFVPGISSAVRSIFGEIQDVLTTSAGAGG